MNQIDIYHFHIVPSIEAPSLPPPPLAYPLIAGVNEKSSTTRDEVKATEKNKNEKSITRISYMKLTNICVSIVANSVFIRIFKSNDVLCIRKYIIRNSSLFTLDYWLNASSYQTDMLPIVWQTNWRARPQDPLSNVSNARKRYCTTGNSNSNRWHSGQGPRTIDKEMGYETFAWNVSVADDGLIVPNEHYMLRKLNTHTHTQYTSALLHPKMWMICGAFLISLDCKIKSFNMKSHSIQNKQNENNKPYTNTQVCRVTLVSHSVHLRMIWCMEVDRFMVAADEEINRLKCLRSFYSSSSS